MDLHQALFRFMYTFEYPSSKSKYFTKIHKPLCYTLKLIFVHFGCILQLISLFTSDSIREFSNVIYVGSIWVNIVVKDIVFIVKKRQIIEIWHQLDDNDFKARTNNEFRYVVDFLCVSTKALKLRYHMPFHFFCRCVEHASSAIFNINAFDISYVLPGLIYLITPFFIENLPLSLWTPFDQLANRPIYSTMYFVGCVIGAATFTVVICVNTIILLFLTFVNFNYHLLAERAHSLKCRKPRKNGAKDDTFSRMIELIKLHSKINR